MSLSTELDLLFEKVRRLEGQKIDPVTDSIFKRLRRVEKKTDELERLKWKLFGAIGAVTIIAAIAEKIFLR